MATKKFAASTDHIVDAAEDAQAFTVDRLQQAQAKMQDGVSAAMAYWQNSMAFGQSQLTALMQSSQIMATGLQEITKEIAASNKAAMEDSVAFTKSLIAAKSPADAAKLQAGFVKATLEKGVAHNRELSQATVELAKQAARPINEQIAKASSVFKPK
jgi:phasin family protein